MVSNGHPTNTLSGQADNRTECTFFCRNYAENRQDKYGIKFTSPAAFLLSNWISILSFTQKNNNFPRAVLPLHDLTCPQPFWIGMSRESRHLGNIPGEKREHKTCRFPVAFPSNSRLLTCFKIQEAWQTISRPQIKQEEQLKRRKQSLTYVSAVSLRTILKHILWLMVSQSAS